MTHPAQALKQAKALLAGQDPRYRQEANVTLDVTRLLGSLENVEDADIECEHPSGGGRIDIFLPRFRTIIEVKRPQAGTLAQQGTHPFGADAQGQLEGYVAAEILAERSRLNYSGRPLADSRWTAILADGRNWRCWTYRADIDDPAATRLPDFRIEPDAEPEELLNALARALRPDPDLKAWVPADPSRLFAGRPGELAGLYASMPAKVRLGSRTKLALWHDMLRASGLSPAGRAGDESLFALHTFLIAVARMVTHQLSAPGDDWKLCLRDGFASWVLDWEAGAEWSASLWATVRRYDWRSRRGDVLRSLYESFVSESDRHIFGEYYTPDWLAGMMVEQALDDEWLEQSVQAAEVASQQGKDLQGVGVIDPACGSGTFLYHSALRLLQAPAMRDLSPVQQADVTALLLNGIDVHPVAVEVAKATLLRALPAQPRDGSSAIRIYLGDSLLTSEDYSSLFGRRDGAMRLETPQGREFYIPLDLVRRDGFPDAMRRLVRAAVDRKPVPPVLMQSVAEDTRPDLQKCRDALEEAIQDEGNSVWTWYAVNRAAPHMLAERKVDRIVANPPWVKLATVQERGRKKAMESLGEGLGLQVGGKQAPHLDIAAYFVLRARDLYLNDPEVDRAIWLVKRSALQSGHWASFRALHAEHLSQTVDLVPLQPFGGGDARRCCLLAEHTAFSATDPRIGHPRKLRAETREPGGRRPEPSNEWTDVRERISFLPVRPPPPQRQSDYSPTEFRNGATVFPYVLLKARNVFPQGLRRVRVETERSQRLPWSGIPAQAVEVPRSWISGLLLSKNLFAFAVASEENRPQAIIPKDESGKLVLDSATAEHGWETLDELWRAHRSRGKSAPQTLAKQLDFAGKLSSQPRTAGSDRKMLLYPGSGDIMRAARATPGEAVIEHALYWFVAKSEAEAGYLVSLLNASSLRRAFQESRRSGRHFDQHPWRNVPVPRFDSEDQRHMQLADLCSEAEAVAATVRDRFPDAGQVKVSGEVRKALGQCGTLDRIDEIVRQLLPDQAEALESLGQCV